MPLQRQSTVDISFAEEDKTDMNKIKMRCWSKVVMKNQFIRKGHIHTNLLKIFDKEGIDLSGGENATRHGRQGLH